MSEAAAEGGNDSGETPAAEEFKAITSQDELNEALKERLARERAKFKDYSDLKAKAAELDDIKQANQSETEKLTTERDALARERDEAVGRLARLEVALEKGLTPSQAKRLVGDTREELEADADELLKDIGKPRSPKPDLNQGRQSGGTASTADQFAAAIGDLL